LRRQDREITDPDQIMQIIQKCDVCSIAFFDEEFPYVVPLNFGVLFDEKQFTFYFHGARAGKKLVLLERNGKVAFEMNCSHKLMLGATACSCTMEYESVCGNGLIELLPEQEKHHALSVLMKQYSLETQFEFDETAVSAVAVLKLTVNHITAKRFKRDE